MNSDSDFEESNSETDLSEEERRRQKGKQRWSSESNNTRRSDDVTNFNTMDLGFFTDEMLYDLFCENKTKISTIEDPLMFLHHLKDHRLITDELCERLENSNDDIDMYRALEDIQKRGEKKIRKFWECVQQKHILQRYPLLSEIIATLKNSLNSEPSKKRKTQERFEDGGTGTEREFKKRRKEGNSESNQAGPSSQCTKSQKSEHVERAYKKEPSQKTQARTEDGGTGKEREVKKKMAESSNQAGRSSQSTKTQKTPDHVKREEEKDPWDRPEHKKRLPVTCGGKEALLDREALRRYYKGNRNCIKYRQKMITPCQFEEMAGKDHCKNWKTSILCQGKTIKYLLEKGILEMPQLKR